VNVPLLLTEDGTDIIPVKLTALSNNVVKPCIWWCKPAGEFSPFINVTNLESVNMLS
jgi:hypothetical protein